MSVLQRTETLLRRMNRFLWMLTAALAAGCACLIFARVLEASVLASPAASQQAAEAAPNAIESISLEVVNQSTVGKAIFRTTRVRAVQVVDELSHYQLKGVSSRGGASKAYLRDNKLKRMETRVVGEFIGPYEIISIESNGIRLRRGADEMFLPKG